MSGNKLLKVEPGDISYTIELKNQPSSSIKLSNKTQDHIGYKVMTASPRRYCVEPNIGILLPQSSCEIQGAVTMLEPFNFRLKDKFLIKSVVARPNPTEEDLKELLNAGDRVPESKLEVVHILRPEVAAAEESTSSSLNTSMIAGELLDIHPSQLRFPFDMKELSCSIRMSNMTGNRVGFKVKTTDPDKYCVQPNIGIVLPQSTCDITVRMRSQTEILQYMQCKDKFLIQSIIARPNSEDITPEMFNGTVGGVDEIKLVVLYALPPRSSNSEELESTGPLFTKGIFIGFLSPIVLFSIWKMLLFSLGLESTHDLFVKGIIVTLLSPIVLYAIWKMVPHIRSLTTLIMKLVVKMIQKLVSDSVEDWIVNICAPYLWALFVHCVESLLVLCGLSIHFLPILFKQQYSIPET